MSEKPQVKQNHVFLSCIARVALTNRFVTKSLRSALKEKIVFKGSLSCFVQTLLKSHSRRYRVK